MAPLFSVYLVVLLLSAFKHGIEGESRIMEEPHVQNIQNQSIRYAEGSTKVALQNNSCLKYDMRDNGRYVRERYEMKGLAWNRSFTKLQPTENDGNYILHYAALRQLKGQYYGAKGTLNVYGLPEIDSKQGSGAFIWVVNGLDSSPDNFNAIQAGWQVNPKQYGDHDTHFVISWTVDADFKTGCGNLDCKGFVFDKSSKYIPGSTIRPLSKYGGEQYDITIKISQDPETGDWWLHGGRNGDMAVGYWPKSLFTSLASGASIVQWGGVAGYYINRNGTYPPMGSAHFPDEGYGRAAYLRNLKLISKNGDLYDPNPALFQDKRQCYRIGGKKHIYFGGPGGCW